MEEQRLRICLWSSGWFQAMAALLCGAHHRQCVAQDPCMCSIVVSGVKSLSDCIVQAADVQAWLHLWVSLIPRSRLESEQNVYSLCSDLPDSEWCNRLRASKTLLMCFSLFLTRAGFVRELVKPQTALGGSGLADWYLLSDNRAGSVCQLPRLPSIRGPMGPDEPEEAQPGWQSAGRVTQRTVIRWDYMYKVCAASPQQTEPLWRAGARLFAGVRTASKKSRYRSFSVVFLPVVKLNWRFALFHSQDQAVSCQDNCREFQTLFLTVSCCFCSCPVLVSTIPLWGESQPWADPDGYLMSYISYPNCCCFPDRVNFLNRGFCFALWECTPATFIQT